MCVLKKKIYVSFVQILGLKSLLSMAVKFPGSQNYIITAILLISEPNLQM